MATQQYFQGRNLVIYYGGVPVGCSKTCTFELTTATSNSTTKCDVVNGVLWTRNSPQENSWKLTDNGVVPVQTSAGMATEHAGLFFVKTQAQQLQGYATFEDRTSGILIGGNVWITSTKITGSTTEDTTYDLTMDGNGPLDFVAVS